jgi:hypothetical protein
MGTATLGALLNSFFFVSGGNQNGSLPKKINQNLRGSPSNENLGLFGFGYISL